MFIYLFRMLYSYLKDRNIHHKKVGKIIVATCNEDLIKLKSIKSRALINGVDLLELSSQEVHVSLS